MSEVEQIESRIKNLSPADLAQLRSSFEEFDAQAWDRQIEADSAVGRLDALMRDDGGRRDNAPSGFVDYPFPLRDGQDARLSLPRDLKMSEVRRLHAFMSTLAVDLDSAQTVA